MLIESAPMKRSPPLAAFGLAAVGLVALSPSLATAAGPPVALIEFRTEGEIAPAVREKLAGGLQAGLAVGLTVAPLDETTAALQAANPGLAACSEQACYQDMGRTLGQRVLVHAQARTEMEFYHLGITAREARTGRVLLSATADCEICTLTEAAAKLRGTAERFSADLGPIVSALPADEPAVAVVAPAPTPAPPVATAPGPSPAPTAPPSKPFPEAPTAAGELPPVPGPDATPPGPADPPPSLGDDFPYGVAAFGALAGGLALLGTGGVLIAKDGDSTCDNLPLQRCATVYDTGQAGLVTVVLGGAGLLTSVVLFLMQQAADGVGPETPPRLPRMPGSASGPASGSGSGSGSDHGSPGAVWRFTW